METFNPDLPHEKVTGRNWRYVQKGKLYSSRGIEISADGKPIGAGPEPTGLTLPDPEDMDLEQLKAELRDAGVSLIGGFKRDSLIKKVKEARNVAV